MKPNALPWERLAMWRKTASLSLKEAGNMFGVSAVNFRAWEHGQKRPGEGSRRNLVADVTGIPAADWETAEERAEIERLREQLDETPQPPPTPPPPTPKRRSLPPPAARTPKRTAAPKPSKPAKRTATPKPAAPGPARTTPSKRSELRAG